MSREHPEYRTRWELLKEAIHRDGRFIARDPIGYSSSRGIVAGATIAPRQRRTTTSPGWLAEVIAVERAGALAARRYSF
jgi:hypothetical protein